MEYYTGEEADKKRPVIQSPKLLKKNVVKIFLFYCDLLLNNPTT